jgi:dTDP-4-amino-4,6-dideoxygalactose transaminase
VAFRALAEERGRDEVVMPAYTCYSVPAAAVAAGLHVRLVDVTKHGCIDPAALAALDLERAAAVVVCNLLGVPEPAGELGALAAAAGAALVDDAAQSLGSSHDGVPVGARGQVGVLSFGRGKPLSGLGGGALAWTGEEGPAEPEPAPGGAAPLRAMARVCTYALARRPRVFALLAGIPTLGIGETVYDPHFERGAIDGGALQLAAAALTHLENANAARSERARRLGEAVASSSAFEPLLASPDEAPAFPRLGVLAPDRHARDSALAQLQHLGASRLYPAALDALAPLAPHRRGDERHPGAARFADRLLTLPTHEQLGEAEVAEIATRLARL